MFANEEQIKTMYLKGQVKVSLREKEKLISKGRTSLIPPGTHREIRAAEIKIRGFLDLPRIHELEAKGGGSVKLLSAEGGFTLIRGEVIRFLLSREGELREFEAKGKASITEQGEGSKPTRVIEGETISVESEAKVLHISGGKGSKPRISLKESDIYAKEIRIFLDSNDLELSDDVKAILKLQKEEERSIGFFSREEPVFITAQKMRYTEEQNRFLFKEKIKMWQERKTLTAEEVMLDEKTGRISCLGGVKSMAPYEPKEGEEERIEISAQTMDYKPDESIILYQNACSLKLKDTDLQAQSISVHLKGKKGDMENIDAHGNVVILQNLREGRGEKAQYDLKKETIVLLGNPVLIDKDKGVVRGDKLTFYMADGRIIVENKDRERSTTVIKS